MLNIQAICKHVPWFLRGICSQWGLNLSGVREVNDSLPSEGAVVSMPRLLRPSCQSSTPGCGCPSSCRNAGAGMLPGWSRAQLCPWSSSFLQHLWCFALDSLPSAEPIHLSSCHPESGAFGGVGGQVPGCQGMLLCVGFACAWVVFVLKCGEGGEYETTTLWKLGFGGFILLGFILTFQMNDAFKLVASWGCLSLGGSENRYLCRWEWCVHATIHHCLTPDVKHFTVPSA